MNWEQIFYKWLKMFLNVFVFANLIGKITLRLIVGILCNTEDVLHIIITIFTLL